MPWFSQARQARATLRNEQYGSTAWDLPLNNAPYFVIDIETSGFRPQVDIVLSIASAHVTLSGRDLLTKLHYELVGHSNTTLVPSHIWELTGLSPQDLTGRRAWQDILFDTLRHSTNRVWIAHHAGQELSFLQNSARKYWRLRLQPIIIDTALVAKALQQSRKVPTLEEVCTWLDIPVGRRHHADEDVRMTAEVWKREVKLCEAFGLVTVRQVIEWTLAKTRD